MDIIQIPLFKGLEPDEMESIREISIELTYPGGVPIFVEGQKTDGFYIVNSGRLKVVRLHKESMEKTLAILGEGDIFGEMTLFGNDTRSATVETIEQTTVTFIPRFNFQMLLRKIPELAIRIIEVLSHRLRQSNRQIEELIQFNARCRFICNLIRLAETQGLRGEHKPGVSLELTPTKLADLIGISQEGVNKLLSELENRNLIEMLNEQIEIVDINELYRQVM